ncbi:unnamed protein product [Mytilus edulis]|uniref:Uncharacterized protein n=1 Tax=Mytilus edulis TaxID=6550 RepID=A0A8S3VCK7_MYTED|nr:unnamed protein product [Mytilus edulis]
MNHSGVDCKFIYNKIQKDTYFKSKKLNPEDMQAIQTLLSDGYTKLDFTLMFKIITHYNIFISPPARGWSSVPNDQETDIGDDAQRLRLERNNLVHMRITKIVKRIDSHIGYFGEASFERRIKKYLSIVIKDEIVENTQKRFLEIEGLEVTGSTPITLLFPNIEDPGKIADLIEPLKEEINRGSVLIKLKGAEMGSLILLLVIDNRTFADKNILTVAISDFLIRLVNTLDIHRCFYKRNDIVLTITEGRECTGNDDRMINKQNEMGSLLLNLEVENAVLMSESNLQDNIEQFLERMVSKINGQKLFNQTELTAIVELNDAVGQFREVSERMKKGK